MPCNAPSASPRAQEYQLPPPGRADKVIEWSFRAASICTSNRSSVATDSWYPRDVRFTHYREVLDKYVNMVLPVRFPGARAARCGS